jgi:hypothetical protein
MLTLLCALVLAAGEDPVKLPGPDTPGMVRDTKWTPRPGDRAVVDLADAPAAAGMQVWNQVGKLVRANDPLGLKPFYDAGTVVKLAQGTPVLVLEFHDFRPPPAPAVTLSGADSFAQYAQEMIFANANRPEPPPNLLEVRVLAGPHQGKAFVTEEKNVARYVEAPAAPRPRPKPAPKAVDPAGRATSLLAAARNLERAGKGAGALDFYRRVVKEHPGTPQAREAAARVKALGATP